MSVELPASHLDLLEGRHTAVLSTVGRDGRPQSTAVFFLLEDGGIGLSIRGASQKARNLRARPACTFFLLDPGNPQRWIEVRGHAELRPDSDYRFRDAVLAKYGMPPLTEPSGTERVAVLLRPEKVNTLSR